MAHAGFEPIQDAKTSQEAESYFRECFSWSCFEEQGLGSLPGSDWSVLGNVPKLSERDMHGPALHGLLMIAFRQDDS